MGAPTLNRCHIGHLREGMNMLAEVIRAKCERARSRHESVIVLVDDDGFVYASHSTSGSTILASLRNPNWIVAVYSCAFEKYRAGPKTEDTPERAPLPTVEEIANDLKFRAMEVRRKRAA